MAAQPQPLKISPHKVLLQAAIDGDWGSASIVFDQYPDSLNDQITTHSWTALHVAAMHGKSEFVIQLASKIRDGDRLKEPDEFGRNPLHYLAKAGTKRAAQELVDRNKEMLLAVDINSETPLLFGVRGAPNNEEVLRYLLEVTLENTPGQKFSDDDSSRLVISLTGSGLLDMSLELIEKHPAVATLTCKDGIECLLKLLASKPEYFPSGDQFEWMTSIFSSRNIKLRHTTVLQILHKITEQLPLQINDIVHYFRSAHIIGIAASCGNTKVLTTCLSIFPALKWDSEIMTEAILEAVKNRQEAAFSCMLPIIREMHILGVENISKRLIQEVVKEVPYLDLSSHSIACLQVLQREFRWFKEVEKLFPHDVSMYKDLNGDNAHQAFLGQHSDLLEKCESWMKDTSSSCIIVAALIGPVALSTLMAPPGGADDKGSPNLVAKPVYQVFLISEAVSFVTSIMSLLVFLSILLTRYIGRDFVQSTSIRVLVGVVSLFFAIASMMVGFSAAFDLSRGTSLQRFRHALPAMVTIPWLLFLIFNFRLGWSMLQLAWRRKFRKCKEM